MENKTNLIASVTRHNVTMEDITSFVKNNIVKFIFLDKNFADISSDETVYEIHKFKSVYRGNTYIRVPLKIVKGEKYVNGIEVDTSASETPDGFAVISKHDLRNLSNDMKKAKKEERIAYGEKLCKEHLDKFNKYLTNNILKIIVKDSNDNVLETKLISGGRDFGIINKEVLSVVEDVNSRITEMI